MLSKEMFLLFSLSPLSNQASPPGDCLQPPIRVEYKLNQSGAAAAACDTSLSSTLMPSNCLWRPLPVCLSKWTPTQTSSQPTLPLCFPLRSPVSITAGFLSHMPCFISGRPRVASVFLNRADWSAPQVCGGPADVCRSL